MVSSHKTESVEAKYDVVLNFPNLELHSAAADGNVGLVHYALTHGQPINSVLHGVQPIHAAAAGGSVSAMRMLIERGADVNAPRLPRRYSNEKKRGAPALGAAGATPLHFAAANGHVNIVQMLLTCGAAPNKSDKLGQTPESLAEHNGHEEVVHVLRIFEQLNANGAGAAGGTSSASPWSSLAPQAGPSSQSAASPSGSTVDLPYASTSEAQSVDADGGSRKGKERALSFVSAKSDSSAAVKVKKSLEGIWRKTSRSASMASTSASRPPEEPLPIGEEEEHSRSNTPLPPPSSSPADGTTPHSINPASPPLAGSPILCSPQLPHNTLDRVISGTSLTSNGDLQRVSSAASGGSAHSSTVVSPAPPSTAPPQPTVRERHPSTSSRRPSLPSILEKAAHPGAAFRAAMRRDHEGDHAQAVRFSPETSPVAEEAPRLGGRLRGRLRSNESGSASAFSSTSSGGSAIHSAQAAAKRYISKHNLSSLFKRSNSPPSRSPSPPKRSELTPINVDEMDEGIERLKRASQDVGAPKARSRSSSFNEGDDAEGLPISPIPTPKSAPATKTRFFEDLGVTPPQATSHSASSSPRPDTPQAIAPERTLGRPRTSSGVIAPSPLANEWARDSDSDGSSPRHGIRRARTELLNKTYSGAPPSSFTQQYHVGPGGQGGKQRSNTLPSGAYPPDLPASFQRIAGANGTAAVGGGLGWQEGAADLRKVATAGQLRESERARAEAPEDEDDEVFHDALISVGEPISREEVPLRQPNSEIGLPPVDQLLLDSEEEADGDGDETTPTGENEEPHYDTHDVSVRVQGRFRGASIGSGTTESSRLATPPGSTVRAASFTSEEGGSERYDSSALGVIGSRRLRVEGKGTMSPPTPSSPMLPMLVTALDPRPGRPRGISTSSTSPTTASASGSGSASGLALSFLQSQSQSQLTPATSLTPGSAPAGTPGLGFPPVPEHEVASSSSSPSRPSPPVTGRKISSRAEAADLVRQNEDDVLQLAQLPPSLDSSRSLAAQLAAYGESHAIEQEFAKQERKQRRAARRRNSGATADDSSDAASFVSAKSAPSGFSVGPSGASSGSRRSSEHRLVSSRPVLDPSTVLVRTDAPRSNSISINSIYDKRAAAYRERMAALTSAPPLLPPPRIRSRERNLSTRQRAVSDIAAGESWLTAGLHHHARYSEPDVDARSLLSGPISVRSAETGPSASGKRKPRSATGPAHSSGTTPRGESSLMDRVMSNTSTAPSSLTSASLALSQSQSLSFSHSHSLTPRASAPAPIADVVSTRYAGLGVGAGTGTNGLAMPPPPTHPSRRPPRDRGPSTSLSASRPASSDVTSLIPGHPNPLLPAKSPAAYSLSASPAGDHYLPTSRPLTLSQAQAAGVGVGVGGTTGSTLGTSPYVSIFSTRYSGGPHDGDESDDDETGARDYTVIENDWRGGHVVGPEPFRRGRWDSLKGAINHLGRR